MDLVQEGQDAMATIEGGGILTAAGFRAGSARCGIKAAEGCPDVALIVCDGPAAGAGVFTTNAFAAAPVKWDRNLLPAEDLRAILVNSGNANACTGRAGERDAARSAGLAAGLVGCRPEQVCVASTGIIGHPLPMEKLEAGIRAAHAVLAAGPDAARAAELAIMTTDTRPKACAVRTTVNGVPVHVGGMAKGSGMIAPRMATMLAFVTTDAAVAPEVLHPMVREAADRTFNRISVDGDSSTNDSVIVLAGGRSGAEVPRSGPAAAAFREALQAVMRELAVMIVRDGEGATKLVLVEVTGAADEQDAERVARAVAESQLVKCAVCGGDPNWGRIVCAAGYSGAKVDPERTSVSIGRVPLFAEGKPTGRDAGAEMAAEEVHIRVRLGDGPGCARVWTCDLTEQYVRINAHYST
jgi:glutamate N-acetyltransferase/amino-acid N-acetyltransferase